MDLDPETIKKLNLKFGTSYGASKQDNSRKKGNSSNHGGKGVNKQNSNNNNHHNNGGYKGNGQGRGNWNGGGQRDIEPTTPSTAPYNFVSIPEKVLLSPMDNYIHDIENQKAMLSDYREYIKSEKAGLSGEIKLDFETLTPLFIGEGNGEFIFPAGKPVIPGSSIRGMVKNIFKVVTCGNLRPDVDFTEHHLYYRCLMAPNNLPAWMKSLQAAYSSRMKAKGRNSQGEVIEVNNAKPGFLAEYKNVWYIVPCLKNPKKIFILEYEDKFKDRIGIRDSRIAWHGTEAYCITGSQPPYKLLTEERFNSMSDIDRKNSGKQKIRYTDSHDGAWNNRNGWLEIPYTAIDGYRNDFKRGGVDLFKAENLVSGDKLRRVAPGAAAVGITKMAPCYYIMENNKVAAFGHGQCFRIPYRTSIEDALPDDIVTDSVDFADAIFGYEGAWGSRVTFGDAQPVGNVTKLEQKNVILGEPNPTSYQLYLKQEKGKEGADLKHWDSPGASYRGYKFYWHQNKSWDDITNEEQSTVTTKIKPVAKGSKFSGTIRFSRLTAVELGALMSVFNINSNKNIVYKLGQAKSLGLGSVRINAKLYIDGANNYSSLFSGNAWNASINEESPEAYINAFKDYVRDRGLADKQAASVAELSKILDWDNTSIKDWNRKVQTMECRGEDNQMKLDPHFKYRKILPTVNDIVANKK